MKRFFGRLIFFILCIVILYPVFIIIWGEIVPPKYRANLIYYNDVYSDMPLRLGELQKYKDIDILFLGSSHAYRSFDTRIFQKAGYVTFNLGSSAQSFIQTELLLDKYLDLLNPKLIILEVYPAVFGIDGVESTIDILSYDKIDWETIKMVITHFHVKTFNTMIYGSWRQFFNRNSKQGKTLSNGTDSYISGGFVEKKMRAFKNEAKYPANNWIIKGQQSKAFDNTLSLIRRRKKEYILIQVPITKQLYQSYKNNQKIDSYFMSRGRYLNYNKLITLSDSTDFYDSNHLNQHGVRIVCEDLVKRITLIKARN